MFLSTANWSLSFNFPTVSFYSSTNIAVDYCVNDVSPFNFDDYYIPEFFWKYLTHFEPETRLCGWHLEHSAAIGDSRSTGNCLIFGSHAPLTTERVIIKR